jgi:hypothetical protein
MSNNRFHTMLACRHLNGVTICPRDITSWPYAAMLVANTCLEF